MQMHQLIHFIAFRHAISSLCAVMFATITPTMQVKRKVSSPERQTVNDEHDKAPAIRPKRKRVRKEEESEGIDLCAK